MFEGWYRELYHSPEELPVYYIPEYLKAKKCWCTWKLEEHDGRETKVPYNAKTIYSKASSTDPSTWATFPEAVKTIQSFPEFHLGVVLAPDLGMVFIDIDHCIDDEGNLDDRAKDILKACHGNFAEISQSGHGVHVFVLGTIPRNFKNSQSRVEMYSCKRFCALTGSAIMPYEPHSDQEALTYVFEKYRTPEPLKREHVGVVLPVGFSDEGMLAKAEKNTKFDLLYHGEWEKAGYSSHSEADIALCMKIAFWCDKDFDTIDRIFRSSALYRPKWDREDYRSATIEKACALVTESISEWKRRTHNEFIECQLRNW